jgi:hypothetical protein
MKYLKLYEQYEEPKRFLLEKIGESYRVWEIVSIKLPHWFVIRELYIYKDDELIENIDKLPFTISEEVALNGVIYQSNDLEELLEKLELLVIAKKYNL